jgi:phage gpG-like protein
MSANPFEFTEEFMDFAIEHQKKSFDNFKDNIKTLFSGELRNLALMTVMSRFDEEKDELNKPWQQLSDSRLKYKELMVSRGVYISTNILTATGDLRASFYIKEELDSELFTVDTDVSYAIYHQQSDKKSRTMPKRSFLSYGDNPEFEEYATSKVKEIRDKYIEELMSIF